ncbi:hypothetical protein ACLB2K_069048 [Fragaria x ananassa]
MLKPLFPGWQLVTLILCWELIHEKSGGPPPSRISCLEFQNMSDACDFVHLDTAGARFTWTNGCGTRVHVELRLDRSLCNTSWFEAWPYSSCIALPRVVSDHNPLIFSASKLSPSGPKPFRFQSMWLNHPTFRDTIATCWSSSKFWGCPMYVTVQKLKTLKSCLRNWNKMVFGDVHQNVNKARDTLSAIQQDIAIHGMTDQKFEDEVDAKFRVLNAVKMQESYWKDRARVKWLTDGDRSTSFFHAYAKVRSTSAQMSLIHDGERILFEPSDIAAHVVGFYQNIYSSSSTPRNLDEDAHEITQFRPIALANFLFKIIPKILASRLSPIVARIISPEQGAFIPGRRITSCIGTVSKCFNLVDRKAYGGNMGIKVDIAKAFDTLH